MSIKIDYIVAPEPLEGRNNDNALYELLVGAYFQLLVRNKLSVEKCQTLA